MAVYRKILLAVDLTADSHAIGLRARALADALGAGLQIVHVIEPVPLITSMPPNGIGAAIVATQAELIASAQSYIGSLAQEIGVPQGSWTIVDGRIRDEIVRVAREHGVDLIVIGARGRHALAFLIKPTEDVVVHQAPCDVLAVRLPDEVPEQR
jgi:universal stress protein A